MMDNRMEIALRNWKEAHGARQLELVFWRPPYFLDLRAKAYQKSTIRVEQPRMISERA